LISLKEKLAAGIQFTADGTSYVATYSSLINVRHGAYACGKSVDFSSDDTVVDGTCTACTDASPAGCHAATCMPGFHSYQPKSGCTPIGTNAHAACAGAVDFGSIESVKDDSCTSCTGNTPALCLAAECKSGFYPYQQGACLLQGSDSAKAACKTLVDFSAVESVMDGTCTLCTNTSPASCSVAMCMQGFHSYSSGTCRPCRTSVDFSNEDSVENDSCSECTASTPASCTVAVCKSGYHSFDRGTCTPCGSTVDFTSVESVVDGSCTSCTYGALAGCSAATCSHGYHSYEVLDGRPGACVNCDTVDFSSGATFSSLCVSD
jgi:hypothetical protein